MSSSTSLPAIPETILVPRGTFLMGTSDSQIALLASANEWAKQWQVKGYFGREQPQHAVDLPEYRIGRYPVTVSQYACFIDAGGYQKEHFWTKAGWEWLQARHRTQPDLWHDNTWSARSDLPLVGVSWYEATAYCNWLSKKTGQTYRLPSEAEWEKAARGTDGRIYPWGNLLVAKNLNTRDSSLQRTVPVSYYTPAGDSPFGCAQMVGNVSEWVLSQFRRYPYRSHDGRNDVNGAGERVIRGGSWFSPAFRARTTARGMNDPHFSDHDVGFRCSCEVT